VDLDRAYALGDHGTASALAARIVSGQLVTDEACKERAQAILEQTKPDRFLSIIGALGLGLVAWLVYNYVL
jgi:hypothetical protein